MSRFSPSPPDYPLYQPSPIPTTVAVVLLSFFFVAVLALCICKWHINRHRNAVQPSNTSVDKPRTGLDPSSLMAFPTLVYSDVKHLRRENHQLECAICLSELEDDSVLRLLTVCYHVFHQECVDAWLEEHTSCPVCRASLDLSPEKIMERLPQILRDHSLSDLQKPRTDGTKSEDTEKEEIEVSIRMAYRENSTKSIESYRRSHTTGHSLVHRCEEDCRYALRLSEDSKSKMLVNKGRPTFDGVSNHPNSTEVLEVGSRRTRAVARSLSLGSNQSNMSFTRHD